MKDEAATHSHDTQKQSPACKHSRVNTDKEKQVEKGWKEIRSRDSLNTLPLLSISGECLYRIHKTNCDMFTWWGYNSLTA